MASAGGGPVATPPPSARAPRLRTFSTEGTRAAGSKIAGPPRMAGRPARGSLTSAMILTAARRFSRS